MPGGQSSAFRDPRAACGEAGGLWCCSTGAKADLVGLRLRGGTSHASGVRCGFPVWTPDPGGLYIAEVMSFKGRGLLRRLSWWACCPRFALYSVFI